MPSSNKPNISVILPVYENSPMLVELHQRLTIVLTKLGYPYELIFIDDDSPDDSIRILKQLAQKDPAVIAFKLSENVGQQRATILGFQHALGETIITMDADLQDLPEAIPLLYSKYEEGFDVVFAGRVGFYESLSRLLFSRIYKWLLHILTGCPSNAGYFLVMKKEIAKKLIQLPGKNIHIVARIASLKPRMISIPVVRKKRPSGKSALHSKTRIKLGVDAVLWVIRQKLRIHPLNELNEPEPSIQSYFGKRKEFNESPKHNHQG